MLMAELTPEQAKAHNKFLHMFRPLDNSFGQDRGTFESKPRFRWEGLEIMDPDVAVPYEEALKILKGEMPHPWMRITEEDLGKQQSLSAMAALSSSVLRDEAMVSALDGITVKELEWEAAEDELDGETAVESMDAATWKYGTDEDSIDESMDEEMRSWQIDNIA